MLTAGNNGQGANVPRVTDEKAFGIIRRRRGSFSDVDDGVGAARDD